MSDGTLVRGDELAPRRPRTRLICGREFKRSGDQALRDRLILTYAPLVKYVAGRLGSGLPNHVEESDLVLVRAARPDQRDRALRALARRQVRDLRGHAHSRLDHRRASLDGLGTALDTCSRPRHRACDRRARVTVRARPDRRGDRRQARHHRGRAGRLPARHIPLVDCGSRRAVDQQLGKRRPGRTDRHDRRSPRRGARGRAWP